MSKTCRFHPHSLSVPSPPSPHVSRVLTLLPSVLPSLTSHLPRSTPPFLPREHSVNLSSCPRRFLATEGGVSPICVSNVSCRLYLPAERKTPQIAGAQPVSLIHPQDAAIKAELAAETYPSFEEMVRYLSSENMVSARRAQV